MGNGEGMLRGEREGILAPGWEWGTARGWRQRCSNSLGISQFQSGSEGLHSHWEIVHYFPLPYRKDFPPFQEGFPTPPRDIFCLSRKDFPSHLGRTSHLCRGDSRPLQEKYPLLQEGFHIPSKRFPVSPRMISHLTWEGFPTSAGRIPTPSQGIPIPFRNNFPSPPLRISTSLGRISQLGHTSLRDLHGSRFWGFWGCCVRSILEHLDLENTQQPSLPKIPQQGDQGTDPSGNGFSRADPMVLTQIFNFIILALPSTATRSLFSLGTWNIHTGNEESQSSGFDSLEYPYQIQGFLFVIYFRMHFCWIKMENEVGRG